MTTTVLGPVTRETGSPLTATTRWPAYTTGDAILADVLAAVRGKEVAVTDILERLSRTNTNGMDAPSAVSTDLTRWPAYTYKSDALQGLLDAVGGGVSQIYEVYERIRHSNVAAWTDGGSYIT